MLEQNQNSNGKNKNLNKNFSSAQLIDSTQPTEINQNQQQRFSLMDKKKQKWNQDISKENKSNFWIIFVVTKFQFSLSDLEHLPFSIFEFYLYY